MDPTPPSDEELVARYRQAPRALHSEDVIALVRRVRREGGGADDIIVIVRAHEAWRVARMRSGAQPYIRFIDEQVYDDLEDAEWAIFRRCWRAVRGEDLGERRGPAGRP